ncbi:hypothetical protein [Pseudomonas syringae]|uniref:Poly-gamma-glutamate biosynthesis protein CapA/YwtB metallophosphatase superfamily n=1 Tax=Pseudomonas syringae pv. actinidiae TaxID=103796 RepID=A0A2V0QER6_PSESF|nr:hypothetical protein [Pseudomonas syringae]GBH08815.1 Poly-gamma-glutamate biosynthesis protein CapA/YwtB metallophosphatase superfamily [Pseudomonas syringae pv. actinidiae]
MKTFNVPRPLTAEEFEIMMSELDLASDWMREQLALRHARSVPVLPASGNQEAICSSDDQEG